VEIMFFQIKKKQTFAKNKNTGASWSSSFALQYNRTFLAVVGTLDI
jgi:hypothetical protein